MSRPWMPLYVADYRRDTAHLSAAEHGAYLLLVMHYWSTGGLPDDDRQLSRIASMTGSEWRRARPTIQAFFQDGWKHKRIEFELTEAARISAAGRKGGEASARSRRDRATTVERPLNDRANDQPTKSPPLQSQPQDSVPRGPAADAAPADVDVVDEDPKAKLFRIGKTTLVSFGVAEKRTGALIGQWLKSRNDPVGLLAAIQFARDHNVAEPVAYISTLVSQKGQQNGKFGALASAADELIARTEERAREDAAFTLDLTAGRG